MATICVFLCGHYIKIDPQVNPDALQAATERTMSYIRSVCSNPHCQTNGRDYYLNMQLESNCHACSLICGIEDDVIQATHDMAQMLQFIGHLSNPVHLWDYTDPRDASLFQAFVTARDGEAMKAVFTYWDELSWLHEQIDDAKLFIQQGQPAGWIDGLVVILENSRIFMDQHIGYIRSRVALIAQMQRSGAWELATYCAEDGVAELAALRQAGEEGTRILAAPISYANICEAKRLIETLKSRRMEVTEDAPSTGSLQERALSWWPPTSWDEDQQARHRTRLNKVLMARGVQRLDTSATNQMYHFNAVMGHYGYQHLRRRPTI